MLVIKEELKVKFISINEDFPDFPEKLMDYISIFRITMTIDFEIQLKSEFLKSIEIQKEITDYIKSKYEFIEIIFTESQLPF